MIKIDPELKALIPPLSKEEFEQLEANINKEGIREPIILWYGHDVIIDGHNRYEIATKHGYHYEVIYQDLETKDDVIRWMILNQFGRRNLTAYDRSILALKLKPVFEVKAKEKQKESGGAVPQKSAKPSIDTRQELAKVAGVSHDTIAKVQKIQEKASDPVKEKLRKNEITINQAYNEVKKEDRKEQIKKQKEDIERGVAILPEGVFEVISIDPPWNYGTQYDGEGRRVANPYPEMTQEQLKQLKLPSADNSVLFLWTTHRFIWDAKELLDLWGYTYRNIIVWDKEKIGMGDLFRMQCEFCIVGIKGKPIFDNDHTWRDIIKESRREHSRKPDSFFNMVDKLCVGRKLEYFSREARKGWEVFGNDTSKF